MPTGPENPILYRAAREERRTPPWLQLALHLLIPALLVLPSAFLISGDFPDWTGQGLARDLERGFALSVLLVVPLFPLRALGGTVAAFTRERELRTLEGLLSSRLSARDLFLGKLAAGVRPLVLDFLLALPLWGLFVLGGGARLGQVLAVQALVVAYTLFAGLLGLVCSLRERTSLAAGSLALGAVAGLVLAGPALDLLLLVSGLHEGLVASLTSPGTVLLLLVQPDPDPARAAWVPLSAALYLAGAGILLGLGLRGLGGLAESPRSATVPARRNPLRVALARAWDNPVWFRHVLGNGRTGSRLGGLLRGSVVPALLVGPVLLAWLARGDADGIERLSRALQVGFTFTALGVALRFPARALAAGARAVAAEREQRTLGPLLGSRTRAEELLAGLLAVSVGLPALELVAWSPALALFALSDGLDLGPVGGLVGFTLVGIALSGTLGLWLSAGEQTPQGALRKGWGVLAALTAGTLVLDLALNWLLPHPAGGTYLFTRVNPLLGLVSALAGEPREAPHLWLECAAAWLVAVLLLVRATARRLGRAG